MAGAYDVVVAAGVESMTRLPMGASLEGNGGGRSLPACWAGTRTRGLVPQGVSAELIAQRGALTPGGPRRATACAATSGRPRARRRPVRRRDRSRKVETDDGVIAFRRGRGDPHRHVDGGPGRAADTVFDEDGVVTAGNSSQISDGAAALLLMSEDRARPSGCAPLARVHAVALAGTDPIEMLTGPIPATRKVLERAGLDARRHRRVRGQRGLRLGRPRLAARAHADPDRVNVNGGAIALGHPLGCSGARLMTTLVHELQRSGGRYGLQTMCEGGGMANATIVECLA